MAPTVAGDTIVGAAHRPVASKSKTNVKGYVRGFDEDRKRLWIFHTIPKPGEFGYNIKTILPNTPGTPVWAQIS
jgi:quinoprotein glucose dehydrogenase